jgi:hypothetical protein
MTMILSVICILLVLVVAFFHYLQGFLSATVSAILTAISVLVAFTLYEPLVTALSPGKFADTAHGMMLVALFAITYLILRILFDKLIPGNVRVPAIVDKVGGGVMGFVVGCLAVGLLAVAAQSLPFGPSIGGYARYPVKDEISLPVSLSASQSGDRVVYDEFAPRSFDHETAHDSLILPVDDMVIGFVSKASEGSAAGAQPFERIHPNYLQELYGQRIGMEQGAKRSAQKIQGSDVAELAGVYYMSGDIPQIDGEFEAIRRRGDDKLPRKLDRQADQVPLVIRIVFKIDAADQDRRVRISTGAVRLVGKVGPDEYRQYHPIGTVEAGRTLVVNKPDDFLFIPENKAADFLFLVDSQVLGVGTLPGQIPSSSELFVEAKRYARFPLAGANIEQLKAGENVQVLRKPQILSQAEATDPNVAKQRLVGSWNGQSGNGMPVTLTFKSDNTWEMTVNIGGQPATMSGGWSIVPGSGPGITVQQTRSSGPPQKFSFTFSNPDSMVMTDLQNNSKTTLTRQK